MKVLMNVKIRYITDGIPEEETLERIIVEANGKETIPEGCFSPESPIGKAVITASETNRPAEFSTPDGEIYTIEVVKSS